MIYLDNAATTRIDDRVFDAMVPYLRDEYGNPGAMYSIGRHSKSAIERAREQVAAYINCKPEQVIFTSCGTEANNIAIKYGASIASAYGYIITSEIEHDSVERAVDRSGVKVKRISQTGKNFVSVDDFVDVLDNTNSPIERLFVSIMHTNNETGIKNDIEQIAGVCRSRGITIHSDCVQGLYTGVNVSDLDLASFSSHKIHGPKGIGCLYARNPEKLSPVIIGGEHQEFGLSGGTENVAGIVGFGKACEIAMTENKSNNNILHERSSDFLREIDATFQSLGISDALHINSDGKIINITISGVDAETMILMLDSVGICVSAGSACRTNEMHHSKVLLKMGLSEEDAMSSLRISFSKYNTNSDCVVAANRIAEFSARLLKERS